MAVGVNSIIQVVGYKNSGKTTLIEKVIADLAERGMRIGTIKHHGHATELVSLDYGTDSWKHRQAGAAASLVMNEDGALQLQAAQEQKPSLDQLLAMYQTLDLDGVLVEGFKQEDYPKLIIVKEESDLKLVDTLKQVEAIVTALPIKRVDLPVFHLNDAARISEWIITRWEKK